MKTPFTFYYPGIVIALLLGLFASLPVDTINAQIANVTIETPAPHAGTLGTFSVGAAFQSRTRNTEKGWDPDGNIGLSFGLGDINKHIGIVAGINVYGLSNNVGEDNNFGSGSFDLQLNRNINDYIFVGAGVRNLFHWRTRESTPRNNRSFFVVGSIIFPLQRQYEKPFSLLFITAGMGNGTFRLDRDFDIRNSGNLAPFGSIALQVLRGTNFIIEWNGYELGSGFSFYPFKNLPSLGGTIAVTDLTEKHQRFIMMLGYTMYL